MKKTGLILEGGGSRGVFTSGVLDFLMEKELYLPYVSGVSCGACNAVDYVSRQIGRTKDCMILPADSEPTMGVRYFLKHRRFIDMDRIFDGFPNVEFPFDYDTYFASPIRCEMVVTNCLTGKAEYLSETKDRERLMMICRASSSLPLVAPIIFVDGVPYLDGGIADSVPIRRSLNLGYKKNVVILTRNPGYRKGASRHTVNLVKRQYKNYPGLVGAFRQRPYVYNKTMELIEQLEERGKLFVIRPLTPTVSRTEKKQGPLNALYQHGYDLMKEQYEALLQYLES